MPTELKVAKFVRENIERGYSVNSATRKKSPTEIKNDEFSIPDKQYDEAMVRIRAGYGNHATSIAFPIQSSISESPCEVGYVQSGSRWEEYLINGGLVYIIEDFLGSIDGETCQDLVRNSLIFCHETQDGLDSLLENVGFKQYANRINQEANAS